MSDELRKRIVAWSTNYTEVDCNRVRDAKPLMDDLYGRIRELEARIKELEAALREEYRLSFDHLRPTRKARWKDADEYAEYCLQTEVGQEKRL